MLGLKLNHVSKGGHMSIVANDITYLHTILAGLRVKIVLCQTSLQIQQFSDIS